MHFKAYDGRAGFDGVPVSFRWFWTGASCAKWKAGDQTLPGGELSGIEWRSPEAFEGYLRLLPRRGWTPADDPVRGQSRRPGPGPPRGVRPGLRAGARIAALRRGGPGVRPGRTQSVPVATAPSRAGRRAARPRGHRRTDTPPRGPAPGGPGDGRGVQREEGRAARRAVGRHAADSPVPLPRGPDSTVVRGAGDPWSTPRYDVRPAHSAPRPLPTSCRPPRHRAPRPRRPAERRLRQSCACSPTGSAHASHPPYTAVRRLPEPLAAAAAVRGRARARAPCSPSRSTC